MFRLTRETSQSGSWPDWPLNQISLASRADTCQPAGGAALTIGALKGADKGFRTVRGQIAVTAFAIGFERQH